MSTRDENTSIALQLLVADIRKSAWVGEAIFALHALDELLVLIALVEVACVCGEGCAEWVWLWLLAFG